MLLMLLAAAWAPTTATADGDPGSDVLVNQSLFAAADAGLSVAAQVKLTGLLRSARQNGVSVRVAIIAHRDDLGAITGLWNKPQAYARFLGYELSLAYKGRLLVVMPNGLGVNWTGHPTTQAYRSLGGVSIRPGAAGLTAATYTAIIRLAAQAGVKLPTAPTTGTPGSDAGTPASPAAGGEGSLTPSADGPDALVIVLGAFTLCALGAGAVLILRRRHPGARPRSSDRVLVRVWRSSSGQAVRRRWVAAGGVAAAAIVLALVSLSGGPSASGALARNPNLDPGTLLSGRPAPEFTLNDQFGRQVSLDAYRGKVVILDFNDSECTTICPLTTTAMLDAQRMLGPAATQVQLLGVDANPKATSIQDVASYSQLHGMLGHWQFLTGSLPQLKQVWRQYHVQAAIEHGLIAHTPALYVIDPHGRLRDLYVTQQSYSAVGQLGQLLATEASHLLPGHPHVNSHLSYTSVPTITPTAHTTLPTTTGRSVGLGPSGSPRLYLFFATWDQEITSLGGQLDALNRYASTATGAKLPTLTAVDEGSVEPSPSALGHFLSGLRPSLAYPVAVDRTGRVADGYEVQAQPWFVLTSSAGRILWYWNIDTQGWLTRTKLTAEVRAALAHAPKPPTGQTGVRQQLAHSPAPLAALHAQASQLLGPETALTARIHALHGYPIVLNVWASWCDPCRQEFGLFAAASARYGRHVAFLGADTNDSAGDAQAFLRQHSVSYPSYQAASSQLDNILVGGLEGTPTTVFINPSGKVTYVHIGQYDSQGTLDADIDAYAHAG